MDVAAQLARQVLSALLQLAAQPFYYIGIVFVLLQYRRQIMLERQLFSTRLHSMLDTAWKTVLLGIVAGMAASFVMAFVGATVPFGAVVWLWVLSALLAVVQVRFICLAYSVGLLGIFHMIVQAFPALSDVTYIGKAIDPLRELPVSSMLALVGLLHLLEAFFVGRQGADMAMPVFVEGKRGKVIGGYQLQQFWPVPLLLLVPLQAGSSSAALPWTPLFGGDIWSAGWTFAAMPVMLGFAEMTTTRLPRAKAKRSARLLLVYSLAILGLAACAEWVPGFALVGSIAVIALHEALFWWSRREETANPPFYVHDGQGLKILGVLPGSPAHEMGLVPGEIIHKANGIKVRTKEELHEALRTNGAFCKLEVINTEGHSKFVQRALYAGEHHLLGVILSPDDKAMYVLEERNINWFTAAERRKTRIAAGGETNRTL
ncbi:PDZ domain-containing protein [Paenibacillus mesophilus]|uniref:PDZ domain-containing protein n=1 Tax=Paenibacillus mesophilus TaxID=2582849 RepID=UPI00110E5D1A|nr:PDZ domain-containing protein [Paenibacillus mesophilus]TMV47199.1 PDZ domain-containing protein [Paenibacillus mesophilus]